MYFVNLQDSTKAPSDEVSSSSFKFIKKLELVNLQDSTKAPSDEVGFQLK